MSFLNELKQKKMKLKATTTSVLYADGTRMVITNGIAAKVDPGLYDTSYGFIVDTNPDTVPACILDGFLYIGSQDSVDGRNFLEHGITHVLSVGIEMPVGSEHRQGVENLFVPCLDLPETNLRGVLEQSNSFLEMVRQCGGRVLVHCNAGVSRSSSVVIGYLMLVNEMSFQDAYDLVKSRRSCCCPNDGFLKQLKLLNHL